MTTFYLAKGADSKAAEPVEYLDATAEPEGTPGVVYRLTTDRALAWKSHDRATAEWTATRLGGLVVIELDD